MYYLFSLFACSRKALHSLHLGRANLGQKAGKAQVKWTDRRSLREGFLLLFLHLQRSIDLIVSTTVKPLASLSTCPFTDYRLKDIRTQRYSVFATAYAPRPTQMLNGGDASFIFFFFAYIILNFSAIHPLLPPPPFFFLPSLYSFFFF